MGSMPVGLAAIKDRLGPLGFAMVRGLERQLSPSDLYSVLAPLAFTLHNFRFLHHILARSRIGEFDEKKNAGWKRL